MVILAKYCAKEHKPRLRADTRHLWEVQLLSPPKVPALSTTTQLMAKIRDNNLITHLENEGNKTRAINSALGRFKQFGRMIVHSSKDNCYVNPKDNNYLCNYKTVNGERGTLENLRGLLYLEGNLRRNFVTLIMGIAAIRHSELRLASNYKFLMENGLSVVPPEHLVERTKRSLSSSMYEGKTSKYKRSNRESSDNEDLRDRIDCERARGRR